MELSWSIAIIHLFSALVCSLTFVDKQFFYGTEKLTFFNEICLIVVLMRLSDRFH